MRDGGSTAILTVNTAYPVLVILLTLLALLTLFKVTLWPIHMIDICNMASSFGAKKLSDRLHR